MIRLSLEFPTLKYVFNISNKEGDKIFQIILWPEKAMAISYLFKLASSLFYF